LYSVQTVWQIVPTAHYMSTIYILPVIVYSHVIIYYLFSCYYLINVLLVLRILIYDLSLNEHTHTHYRHAPPSPNKISPINIMCMTKFTCQLQHNQIVCACKNSLTSCLICTGGKRHSMQLSKVILDSCMEVSWPPV